MAAVASTPRSDSSPEPRRDASGGHSPSQFTAVNGQEIASHELGTPSTGTQNGSGSGEGLQDVVKAPDESRLQRSTPFGDLPHIGGSKRKRSGAQEEQGLTRSTQRGTVYTRSPTSRTDGNIGPDTPLAISNSTSAYGPNQEQPNLPSVGYSLQDGTDDIRSSSASGTWQDYNSQLISQAQRAQQIDTQLAEALQRESQSHNLTQNDMRGGNCPIDDALEQSAPSVSAAREPSEAAAQSPTAAPKRKRVFSNRTKTGCLTCRRRKKKCDEQRPACANCIRGGFPCEGYASRTTWQKPSIIKTPVPLQSKRAYSDNNSQYLLDTNQQHESQNSATEPVDSTKLGTIVDENDRASSHYNTSPTSGDPSRESWSKRGWPANGHPSFVSDHVMQPDNREVPPIHELPRDGSAKADYQVVPSIREFSHAHHSKSGISLFSNPVDQRPVHMSALDPNSPKTQARMALSIEHQLSTRAVSSEETEKDKMMRGELYRPFDIHLLEERERCKAALWRFNSACNPLSGVSVKEQNRLLKEIFVPPANSAAGSPSGMATPRSAGSIGQGAVVEAPFNCHYGLNIHIGEDVMISENCLFVDDCSINIGAHTWIGPNVTILSSMAHASMQERKGSQSRYQGRPVTIEEDCYVGAGCTIYPGVRLRRGAYVAPGEVVKTDIVAYGFQGLKPSYM